MKAFAIASCLLISTSSLASELPWILQRCFSSERGGNHLSVVSSDNRGGVLLLIADVEGDIDAVTGQMNSDRTLIKLQSTALTTSRVARMNFIEDNGTILLDGLTYSCGD